MHGTAAISSAPAPPGQPRLDAWERLLPGLAGGVAALAASFAVAGVLGLPSLSELIAEIIASRTPLAVIEQMIQRLGSDAKRLLLAAVLTGTLGVGLGLGLLRTTLRWPVRLFVGATLGLAATLGLPLASMLSGAGLADLPRLNWALFVGLGVSAAAYLMGYAFIWRYLHPRGFFAPEESVSRRRFLRSAGGAVAVGAAVLAGGRLAKGALEPPEVAPRLSSEASATIAALANQPDLQQALHDGVPGLSTEITPNDTFYVVSKNFFRDPEVDATTWSVEVNGLVERPMRWSYDELRRLPDTSQFFTLQCISNEVGGDLMGNAAWRGVPLPDLLRAAGVRPGAVDVVLYAADGYTDSIPLAKALQSDTMLVYEMNGERISREHGFPARLLVPDIYGMKNVKWVTRIEVVEYDYLGYWMTRGWGDSAVMHTSARIDLPRNGSFLRPGTNYVGGVAIAGQRGVRQVEVSFDGGQSWQKAEIKPPLGQNTWRLWLLRWEMPADAPETLTLLARATDGTGAPQIAEKRDTIPDGATGYHAVTVRRARV